MIRAATAYDVPQRVPFDDEDSGFPDAMYVQTRPTTPLWTLAEQCAAITHTQPKRWLRYGEVTLRLALAHLGEKGDVRKRAAFLVWAIKFHCDSSLKG